MTSAGNAAVTRRLAAILIADVVGYTRLMERDDPGTFSRLHTIRDEVVDPAIVSHGGRIVKTAGDGLSLAAAYGQTGQPNKAKEAATRLIRAKPDLTIDLLRKRRYSSHPDYRRLEEEGLFAGLRKAGIPEK